MNASIRPSGDKAGDTAESVKFVICVYVRSLLLGLMKRRETMPPTARAGTKRAAPTAFQLRNLRPRKREAPAKAEVSREGAATRRASASVARAGALRPGSG